MECTVCIFSVQAYVDTRVIGMCRFDVYRVTAVRSRRPELVNRTCLLARGLPFIVVVLVSYLFQVLGHLTEHS